MKKASFIRRKFLLNFTILLSLTLTQCSKDDDLDPEEPSADCSDIIFSAAQGIPATTVEIAGLSPDMGEEPLLWVSIPGETEMRELAFLERTEEDKGIFVVPLHPTMLMEGGEILLTLTSGDETIICQDRPFTIQPLHPAEGVLEEMVDHLEASFYHLADLLGADPEELLVADVKTLDQSLAGLATGLQGIKGPDNPYSLRAMLSGEATYEGEVIFDGPEKAIAEALLVSSGLADIFQNISSSLLEIEVEQGADKAQTRKAQDQLDIDPITLHRLMWVQEKFSMVNGPLGKASREAFGYMMGGISVGATAVGAVPVGAVAGLAGTAVGIQQLAIDMVVDLLPSKLDGFLMEVDPEVFYEDDPDPGQWEAQLVASNNGYTFDWPAMLGMLPGWGKLGGGVARVAKGSPAFKQGVEIGFQVSLDAVRSVFGIVEGSDLGFDPNSFVVTVDPERSRERDFFDWEMRTITTEKGGDPFVLDANDELLYHPREVGTSEIRISTKGGSAFLGQVVNNNRQLGVDPIMVEVFELSGGALFGPPVYMEVDDESVLQANLENALDEEVTWRVTPDNTGLVIHPTTDNRVLIVANEPGEYVVVAESATRTGPRAPNTPVRWGSARVIVDGLRVNSPDCLRTGQNFQFEAWVGPDPIEFSELNWTVAGPGSINASGIYSGSEEGDVEVEFSLKENPRITATVNFIVREVCLNRYEINVASGPAMGNYSGEIEYGRTDYFLHPMIYNLDTEAGPGLTQAMLTLHGPNIDLVMEINLNYGVPNPIGEGGSGSATSKVVFMVSNFGIEGIQGQMNIMNYKTHKNFTYIKNLNSWSGTLEFSGMFYIDKRNSQDEEIPPFQVSGRIVVLPSPGADD